MSTRIPVELGPRSYDVTVGGGVLDQLPGFIQSMQGSGVVVITDDSVARHYGDAVCAQLGARRITVPAGEDSKSLDTLDRVYAELLGPRDLDRRTVVVALGGGMVMDLAGFAAATLFRGVRWIGLPTSLLAMLDASVGGKTAINRPTGRNLVGAFHQPSGVFCDLKTLDTLPQREFTSALAEAVKTAVIGDAALLDLIESRAGAIMKRDPAALRAVIEACVRFKAAIVREDEHETTGRRAILNFGHTLAHALEHLRPGRWLHGEAVSIGMCAALRLSVAKAGFAQTQADRIRDLLHQLELPVDCPADVDARAVGQTMLADKKRERAAVRFVLMSAIGNASTTAVELDDTVVNLLLGRSDG